MTWQRRSGLRRLGRVLAIAGCGLLLVASAAGAYLWLLHGYASMQTYHPPVRVQPRPAGHPTAPLAAQVVLVVIDGLRDDAVAGMPTLSLLRRQGASARAIVRAPTCSEPAWATLVTGAWPEMSGAPLLNVPEDQLGPIPADHIFAAARRANLTTALAGSSAWERMIPREMLDAHYAAEGYGAAADQQVADTALRFLRHFRPNLTLVYFGNVGEMAHRAGASGLAYREATLQVDDHLRDLVEVIDLRHAVLIVVSDHGEVDRGGHGGADRPVVTTPFVAVGEPIVAGDRGLIAQTDVAPTIAAILGAPVPRLSQGIVRFDMLRCDDAKKAETQVEVALQRQDYADLYLHGIGRGSLSETGRGDVAVAVSSLEVGNLESAYGLASIAVERIDQEVALARQRRIQRERGLRLPIAAGFVALPLLFLLLRGGRRGFWLLLSAAVTVVAYHALFVGQGGVYSISGLAAQEVLLRQTAWRVGVASVAGALMVLWRLARDNEGSALEVVQTSLGYSLLLVYLLGCQAAFAYWLNGARVVWYVPDMTVAFWQLSALLQIPMVAALGIGLPAVLLLAGLAYQGAAGLSRRVGIASGGR